MRCSCPGLAVAGAAQEPCILAVSSAAGWYRHHTRTGQRTCQAAHSRPPDSSRALNQSTRARRRRRLQALAPVLVRSR